MNIVEELEKLYLYSSIMDLLESVDNSDDDVVKIKIMTDDVNERKGFLPEIKQERKQVKPEVKTKFVVTPDYIVENIFPSLKYYSTYTRNCIIALMEKFRTVPDYQCILNVTGDSKYVVTPQIVINLIVTVVENGWLDE